MLATSPVLAQEDVTDKEPTIGDVAMSPLKDLNLAQDPIPAVLLSARDAPYANSNISGCEDIRRAIGDLDAVLGDDFDTSAPDERGVTVTGVAKSVVSSFIPFRGIIRELSGANAQEYNFREAIAAGMMRRAYLKGMGQQLDCPYPARPAPAALVARLVASEAAADAEEAKDKAEGEDAATDGTQFVARPVVQGT